MKHISQMNKTELKAECDGQGIPYPEDVTNKELRSLLNQAATKKKFPKLKSSDTPPEIPTRKMLLLSRLDGKVNIKINPEPDELSLEGFKDGNWEFLCTVTTKGGKVKILPTLYSKFRLMRGDTVLETANVE